MAQRTYTPGRTSLSAMIFNKVLEAELEQCLEGNFVLGYKGRDDWKGTRQFNLDSFPGRLIGREWRRLLLHEYERGRSPLGSSTAPPPRLPCRTLWIPRRTSNDFPITTTRARCSVGLLVCYSSTEELKMEGCLESGDSLIAARLEYGRTLYPDYPMASFTKVRNVPIALQNVYEGARIYWSVQFQVMK